MSAVMVTLRTDASEVPAVIAGSVNLLRFSEALARAGLVGRHDAKRGVLVIEPVPPRCRACGGNGCDDDSPCEFCEATRIGAQPPQTVQERPADAPLGLCIYNAWTEQQRAYWHRRPGSAVPADAWAAFKAGRAAPTG